MNKLYYKKNSGSSRKKIRYTGLGVSALGAAILLYFGFPVLTSYTLLQHVYASQNVTTPIPSATMLNAKRIKNILTSSVNSMQQVDYGDAKTWFPSFEINPATPRVEGYTLSIPKINIKNAYVSTVDYNVNSHLVNYGGTAVPPDRGNAVVFGHSTIPQLFNHKDYKTIFAKLHLLEKGDSIDVTVDGTDYSYKVISMDIVAPEDFTPLMQEYDHNYLTLITCTPPGTIWERLIVKAILITPEK